MSNKQPVTWDNSKFSKVATYTIITFLAAMLIGAVALVILLIRFK